ncbi:hypothetical protein BFW86_19985 [Pseudomonas fluorescens]|nr:hypothetical protein BFW86_19985 [Pseudomonas fluorescens]
MEVGSGVIESYNPATGEGLIALDGGGELVLVNRRNWIGTTLWVGRRMRFQMRHGREGVYALRIGALPTSK